MVIIVYSNIHQIQILYASISQNKLMKIVQSQISRDSIKQINIYIEKWTWTNGYICLYKSLSKSYEKRNNCKI